MKIWPRLRGRAGPAPDVGGHEPEPEPNKQLEVIGASTNANVRVFVIPLEPLSYSLKDQDPLHVLLQYIAEVSMSVNNRALCLSFYYYRSMTDQTL